MPTNYDIIIIGAGPSGLSTALHLERIARDLGLATLIVDKSRHPRPKLCAGGVLAEGEAILAKLGLDLTEVPHTNVDKATFGYQRRGLNVPPWQSKRPLFRTVRRDEFDAWLAENARKRGIEIQEDTQVKDVIVDEHGARVVTDTQEYRAKVVVGADGSNSIVRRKVMGGAKPHVGRALEVITPPTPSQTPANAPEIGAGQALFDFSSIPQGISGYVWDFPTMIEGQPMRCWGIYDSNTVARDERRPLRSVLAEEMAEAGYRLEDYPLKGHPIRWYEPANKPAMRHVLLVGDALGAGALLGEGISPALGYGRVAAESIRAAFQKKNFSFSDYRYRLWRSRLGGSLWRRTLIAKIFYLFKTDFWQRFIWHYFGWVAGMIGLLFVVGWESKLHDKLHKDA